MSLFEGQPQKAISIPHIRAIPYDASAGNLRRLYDRIKGPGNNVDNVIIAHSLRPHTMQGHMGCTNPSCTTAPTPSRNGFWKRWESGFLR